MDEFGRPWSSRTRQQVRAMAIAAGLACVPVGVAVASSGSSHGSSPGFGLAAVSDDSGSTSFDGSPSSSPSSAAGATSTPGSTSTPSTSVATSSSAPGTLGPSTSTPRPSVPASPGPRTFASAGGTAVVNLSAGGSLSLVSASPAGGFSTEVHDSRSDRVEVRFEGASVEWRIRVEVEHGQLTSEITVH